MCLRNLHLVVMEELLARPDDLFVSDPDFYVGFPLLAAVAAPPKQDLGDLQGSRELDFKPGLKEPLLLSTSVAKRGERYCHSFS